MNQRIVYHFAWGSMRSKPCLIGAAADRLRQLLRERADALQVELTAIRVLPDCVYVAVEASPELSPHHIVCQFKAHSSRCLRHEFQEMTRIPTVWTRAYLVLAGEHVTPDQVLQAFCDAQPPKRRPGRPRTCDQWDRERNL